MNYIKLFQVGGIVQEQSPEEKAAIMFQVFDAIGIDQETAMNKLEQIAQSGNEETLNNIQQAVDTIVQTSQNPTEETQQAVQMLTDIFGSKMFKCGGKLQTLVDKFGKGGKSKCGCGKKIKKGARGVRTGNNLGEGDERRITQKDTIDTYHLPNGNEVISVHPTDGSAPTYTVSSMRGTDVYSEEPWLESQIGIFAKPLQWLGFAAKRITPEQKAEYEAARQATFNKRGGIVKAQPGWDTTNDHVYIESNINFNDALNDAIKNKYATFTYGKDSTSGTKYTTADYMKPKPVNRTTAYYKNHMSEGDVRKIQMFLSQYGGRGKQRTPVGEGYYKGAIDGKIGPQTIEAIKQYQRDHGLIDDGMWGGRTNAMHKVLSRTWGPGESTSIEKVNGFNKQRTTPTIVATSTADIEPVVITATRQTAPVIKPAVVTATRPRSRGAATSRWSGAGNYVKWLLSQRKG